MTKRVGRRSPSPTSYPRGSYRSPYPPPTTYPYPRRNRSAEIITISLLVAAFVLLGLGGMLWLVQARLVFGPTPTPTPTAGAPVTATPDFLATRVAEDFLTQQAYQMALLGTLTPTPFSTTPPAPVVEESTPRPTNTSVIVRLPGLLGPITPAPPTPTPIGPPEPESTLSPVGTPTSNIINLPIVVDSSLLPTPTPAQVAEPPTATETTTPTPTETPPLPVETSTPTPTEIVPTPSPTTTPVPPTQSFVVSSLQGIVEERVASLRLGPSTIYTEVSQIEPGTRVTILKRNPSGEWLYICCVGQEPVWSRQASVRARGNSLQSGAPEDSNPNDVRWLAVEQPPAYLTPLPTPVPPAPDDFPLPRYDRHGAGRVDQLPLPPFRLDWTGLAGLELISPVAVVNQAVLVASLDNHLYSFERHTGSQFGRFDFCQFECGQVRLAPMIYQNEIFIVDQNRTVWAFSNPNNPNLLWRVRIDQPALTSFNIFSGTLFLATGEGDNHTLLALDRDNGDLRWDQTTGGPGLRYPVIGDQLVYAADSTVEAYDVFTGQLVWENDTVRDIIAGPAYASPGPSALAELYVVAGNNRIYALDANTGDELWNIDNGESATSLAINENLLFVAGNGYVKAISRHDHNERWRAPAGNQVMGGPLVDANRVLVVAQAGGTVHLFENQSGSAISVPSIGVDAGGAPAVSGGYIFVPGTDGRLYSIVSSQ
jgi:outer membrane protein assembly factor BamB